MTSEIRVNKIENRSGLGTVTFADTGVDLAGIVTATTFSGSGASLTTLPAGNLTGTVADARISTLTASKLSGALPAISAANLTNVPAANVVGVHTSLTVTNATTTGTAVVGGGVTISESGIEASGIGITCANINGTQIGGRKNIIINGAMNVAQRGTSYTGTDNFHTVDRILTSNGGLDENCTMAQVDVSAGTTPYTEGFRKAFKMTNGNQTSGAESGDYVQIQTRLEAQDIANSGWNYTSTSSFVTLQFWVKSSVAQNFYGYIRCKDGTAQGYPFETGSLSANTWTKIVKTIPGNSNLTFDNNNEEGFQINISPFWGTSYTGSVSLNAWGGFNGAARTPDYTSTWYTTNDATFEITGLQLEVGSQATAFEHRTIGDELTLCHRYCQVYPKSTGDKYGTVFNANVGNSGWVQGAFTFPEMRSSPTATSSGNFRILVRNNAVSVSSFNYYHASKNSLNPQALTSSTLTLGDGAMVTADNDASAKIILSSEL